MDNIARAHSALNHLDSGCPREEWVRIGMAVKEAGLSFDDFHDWSKNAGNYKGEADSRAAWQSFKESGGITAATLFHMALDKGWKDPFKVVSNFSNGKSQGKRREVSKTLHNEEQNNRVLEIWNRCVPATPAHEYIMRKQGRPDGLRVYPVDAPTLIIDGQNVAGYLVAPCLSDGIPQTLQFIPPGEGKKLNLGGASFNDGFFVVGEINEDTLKIYPTESIGNAWAIFQATGAPSVVFFGSSRTARVVKVLRTKYPKVNLTQVPDKGKESQAAEIASQFGCQWIELPHDKPSNYDVNDYAQEYGHDALAVLLTNVKAPEMRYKLLSGTDLFNAPPMRWMVQGVIPAEGLAALYGASGSGKSFLILDMAFAIAGGEAYWFGLRVTKAPVTYICLEGESGVGKRIKAWSIYCGKPVPNELRFVTQPFNLLGNDISELAKAIIAGSGAGGLVIIDTLNRAAPGADENSSIDMGNIIAAAKHLQSLIGGVVLLVHHTGKDTTKGLRGTLVCTQR